MSKARSELDFLTHDKAQNQRSRLRRISRSFGYKLETDGETAARWLAGEAERLLSTPSNDESKRHDLDRTKM